MLLAGIDPLFVEAANELTESGRVNLMRGIGRAARNLVPNPWVRAADWIEQNLVIPNGSRPGPVVLDPIQKAICDAIQDDGVTHVLWLKPPRSGSTTLTACLVIWKAAYEGHDTIVYERGDKDAQDFHDKKLRPILEASTAIAHFLRPDSRSGIQDSWTDIYGTNGAAMQQRGVQSDSNFKAIRGALVDLQEVGDKAYGSGKEDSEGTKLGQAETRGAEYPFPKFNLGGTPTTVHCLIVTEYEKSDKRLLMMQFPCCQGEPQPFLPRVSEAGSKTELKGAGLKFRCDAEGEVSEIGYECGHCGVWLREDQRNAIMAGGRFAASERKPKRKTYAGFYTWAIHSKDPFFEWANIVGKYRAQLADPRQAQEWQNLYLAQAFVPVVEGKRDPDGLASLCEDFGGVLPDSVLYHFVGIDTQRGSERRGQLPRHELVWVGVGANQEKWVLKRQVIERVPVMHVDDDGVVTEDWDRVDPFSPEAARLIWDALDVPFFRADGTPVLPSRVGVDTGYEGTKAMAFCAHKESRARKIVPFKGRNETWGHFGKRAPTIVEASAKRGRANLQLLGTFGLKDHIEVCLNAAPGDAFSFHYSLDLQDTDFFDQFTAEILEENPRNPDLTRWAKERSDASNEAYDCVILALGAMHYHCAKNSKARLAIGLDADTPAVRVRVALNGPRPGAHPSDDDADQGAGDGDVARGDEATEKAKAIVRAAMRGASGLDRASVKAAATSIRQARRAPAEQPSGPLPAAEMLRRLQAGDVPGGGRQDRREDRTVRVRRHRAAVSF